MPTKNEDWVLPTTIKAGKLIADHILVSDQNSDDKTIKLLEKEDKVTILQNTNIDHSNVVRWQLLDEARKIFGKNNIIINLDADEILPPQMYLKEKKNIVNNRAGTVFSSPWVQLWRSVNQYRDDDSVWNPKKNNKQFMFIDNGKMDYERTYTINDHTSRVPTLKTKKNIPLAIPLLHLQFVNWERSQMKQIWYQCKEVLNGGESQEINNKYRNSQNEDNIQFSPVKSIWIEDIIFSPQLDQVDISKLWYFKEVIEMFEDHGVEVFKELNIWHNSYIKDFINN